MQNNQVLALLSPPLDKAVCERFLEYYSKAKNDQFLGRWDDSITKYGKFLEFVAKAIYQYETKDNSDHLCSTYTKSIRNKTNLPDLLRLYIPNSIDAAYGIRNNRDAAHATLGIISNVHDCNYSAAVSDWILGELIIELGAKNRAQVNSLLSSLTSKKLPLVYKTIEGKPIILTEGNSAWLNALIVLYNESTPLNLDEISDAINTNSNNTRTQLKAKPRMVTRLSDGRYQLLPPGVVEVENYIKSHS